MPRMYIPAETDGGAMMKKVYSTPIVTLIALADEDIVRTSEWNLPEQPLTGNDSF